MKKPNFAAMNPEVAKAIGRMMAEQGENFSLEKVNLAELARRTGLSRRKLRRMKQQPQPHNHLWRCHPQGAQAQGNLL